MKTTNLKTYSELIKLKTFEERFDYVKIDGTVGIETFGFNRYLNQVFYKSDEWIRVRNYVLIRDGGFDLAHPDRPIIGRIIIHHLNPITEEEILKRNPDILDPEFLVSTSFNTHNAIHYSDESLLLKDPIERKPNDTKLW